MDGEQGLSIGEAAARLGLSAHTLRYYERAGLIEPVARTEVGRRRYRESDLDWFAFLIRLRETGMPIAGMRAYAELRAHGDATLVARRALLTEHRERVVTRIAGLRGHLDALEVKVRDYDRMIDELEGRP